MKISNADLALTDSIDSKRSIYRFTQDSYFYNNHYNKCQKKDLYQCRLTFHGIQSCTTGWCTETTRERGRGERGMGAESRVSTLYDKLE